MDEPEPLPEHVYSIKSGMPATVALTGGAIASTSDDRDNPQYGAVGLIVAFTGLAAILVQAFRAWLDSRSERRLVADQNAKIQEQANQLKQFNDKIAYLEIKREEERKKRHDLANSLNGQLLNMQNELLDSKIMVATLSTKLGLADELHATAINSNIENIQTIASRFSMPLPAPTPKVDPLPKPIVPIAPGLSGDDIPSFNGQR